MMKASFLKAETYLRKTARFDLVAGLTVAMVGMPQAMAYAAIAGVNPIYGIYTAIVPAIAGSFFGSSNFLISGPSNASALVTYGVLSGLVEPEIYLEAVFALAILSGLIKLILGGLRLGGITRYISNSVLIGFLAGVAVLICIEQLGNLLGLPIIKNQGAASTFLQALRGLPNLNPYVLATAVLGLLSMAAIARFNARLPSAMFTLVITALFAQLINGHERGIRLVMDLSLPKDVGLALHLPVLPAEVYISLLPLAGSVALFSLVEAMSITRALSLTSGQKVNSSREFISQGLASIAGGLTQCLPASGSPSRSAVNYNAGAKTRLAGIFSGGFVWLLLVIFAGWIGYIPIPGLAAVVVVSAIGLINPEAIRLTWRTRLVSRLVMAATFAATILLPLHLAIYLGVLLSLAIYLYESGHLKLRLLIVNRRGKITEKNMTELEEIRPPLAVVNVEGDLYFGAVNDLENAINTCIEAGVKVLVLRVRRMRMLASTGVTTLQWAIINAQRKGMTILLSGVNEDVWRVLESSNILQFIGEEHVFRSGEELFSSTIQAVNYGRELVNKKG